MDFESIYKKYPRKMGKQRGMEKCRSQIKTMEDLQKLERAVDNYGRYVKGTDDQFIKHFSTFMGCWRDWVDFYTDFDREKVYRAICGDIGMDLLNEEEKNWIGERGGRMELGQRKTETQIKKLLGI